MIPQSILKPYAPPLLDNDFIGFYNKYDYGDKITRADAEKLLGKNEVNTKIKQLDSVIVKLYKLHRVSYRLGIVTDQYKGEKRGVKYKAKHLEEGKHRYVNRMDIYSIGSPAKKHARRLIDIINAQFKSTLNQKNDNATPPKVRWKLLETTPIPPNIKPPVIQNRNDLSYSAEDNTPLPELLDDLNHLTTPELHTRYIAVAVVYLFETRCRSPINMNIVEPYDAAVKQCIAEFGKRDEQYFNLVD